MRTIQCTIERTTDWTTVPPRTRSTLLPTTACLPRSGHHICELVKILLSAHSVRYHPSQNATETNSPNKHLSPKETIAVVAISQMPNTRQLKLSLHTTHRNITHTRISATKPKYLPPLTLFATSLAKPHQNQHTTTTSIHTTASTIALTGDSTFRFSLTRNHLHTAPPLSVLSVG